MMKYLPILLVISEPLLAAEKKLEIAAVDPLSSGYLLKLMLVLGLILLLIFGMAWLMKRMQLAQNSANSLIRIVSAISVGQRDRIALIQVGDEQILVGLTPGRIEKLHALKTPLKLEDAGIERQNFTNKFNQMMNRSKGHAND